MRGTSSPQAHSGGTAGTKAVLYAAGPLFTQRPPNSTPLSPPAVFADAQKRKKPPKPGQSHCCAGYEPFHPLKSKARLARALIEFDPRQAAAPKFDARHGVLSKVLMFLVRTGQRHRIASPIAKDV